MQFSEIRHKTEKLRLISYSQKGKTTHVYYISFGLSSSDNWNKRYSESLGKDQVVAYKKK